MSQDINITDLTTAQSNLAVSLEDGSMVAIELKHHSATNLLADLRNLRRPANDVLLLATLAPDVAAQIIKLADLMVHHKLQAERLVNAMFTQSSTVSAAAASQAQRNAEARQDLIDEFGLYDSEQVAHIAGSTAKNRSATASRWLADRQVFAVEHLGGRYYPSFQFGVDGRPKPIIKEALRILEPHGLDGWEVALWFTTATGWLDDKRPVDRLAARPEEVLEAANHTFDEVAG